MDEEIAVSSPEAVIEPARAGDGARIARLLGGAYPPSLLGITVWSSPKIARYVEDLLHGAVPDEDPMFGVIRRRGTIAGAIYLRRIDGSIFVDSVCADEAARRDQLTNLLILRSMLDYAREHPLAWVAFDVFESKRTVRAWLRRIIGGRELHRRTWWRIPLPPAGRSDAGTSGLDEADRNHARWGFSKFQVVTAKGRYSVGRLPGRYFRVDDPEGARDPHLLLLLASLDPSRELLAAGETSPPSPGSRRIDTLIRSRVAFEELIGRLRSQIPARLLEGAGAGPAEPPRRRVQVR